MLTRLIWTVRDDAYTAINILVGILFGLTLPSLHRILKHLIAVVCYEAPYIRRKLISSKHVDGRSATDETIPILHMPSNEDSSSATRETTPSSHRLSTGSRQRRAQITWWTSFILILICISLNVAGMFVTKIPAKEAALSGSKRCGYWGLIDDANAAAVDADTLLQGEKQTIAGQYARDCYGPRSATSTNHCSMFREQAIDITDIEMHQQCPFVNDTYCPGTGFTAVKFTTGLVDAKTIGVNVEKAPKLNRTMMCVPLDIKAGFVEDLNEGNETGQYGYRLGSVGSVENTSNFTFRTWGDTFEYDVRSYTMR